MAKFHGRNAYFTLDGNAMHEDANSITLEIVADVAEATPFGEWWKAFLPGMIGWTISGDLFYDSATNHSDHTLWNQWEAAAVAIAFRPSGSVVGQYSYTGSASITGYTINPTIGGPVVASFSLQGTGQLTRTVIS